MHRAWASALPGRLERDESRRQIWPVRTLETGGSPSVTAPARVAAYHALSAIDDRTRDLPAALAEARRRLSDPRDKALTAEIVHGTLRWQRTLDALIAASATSGRPPADPRVLIILRLSVYQILHLDRVPVSAVVDDAVELARLAQRAPAAGFVNGLLRSLVRRRHRLALPPRPQTPADRQAALAYLGVTHSHPDWLARRWLDRFGFDAAEAWVTFNNATPAVTLRVNTLRGSRDDVQAWLAEQGVETSPTRYAPDGLVVESAENPAIIHQATDRYFVQDEASQLVPLVVGARPGERVLDLCAAPGGKTTAMAGDMRGSGTLVACDVRPRRVRLLRETLATAGLHAVRVVHVPRQGPLPFGPVFDRVLVDAPCSGLGTVRRDPDLKWRREETELAGLAAAQTTLLQRAAAVVAPGGRLVYSTCSSEPEENDEVVERFLSSHPQFSLSPAPGLPASMAALVDARGVLRTLPHRHRLEAFYAAGVVRTR
jgi:16S rRNA (cytosine967-C5)-methyltransferase